ncbi:MAG: chromosome partitioning ATPase, partial [Telluria sp.]
MSIIEKAASRIEQGRSTAKSQAPGAATQAIVEDAPAVSAELQAAPPVVVTEPAAPARRAPPQRVELDLERMRGMGMVTAAAGRTAVVEEFRIIKRPLLQHAFSEQVKG